MATASAGHRRSPFADLPGFSRFSVTTALALYSETWTLVEAGEGGPILTAAQLPAGTIGSGCPLYGDAGDFLPTPFPIGSELEFERIFDQLQTGEHGTTDGSGVPHLLVMVAIDNDVQVFANGMDITPYLSDRGAHDGQFDQLSTAGRGHSTNGIGFDGFLRHEGCAFRDEAVTGDHKSGDVTFAVPIDDLTEGGWPNSLDLEILARDRGGSAFFDVQVGLLELPTANEPIEQQIPQ